MSIIIGADIVPSANNFDLFKDGNVAALIGDDLLKIISDADFRVFNLEAPLTDVVSPIDKCGRTLYAESSCIKAIKRIGANLMTLANNHIMDQGEQGLLSTINLLEENAISFLGAGNDLVEAQRSFVTFIKNKKIGFYACAEHEFSIAEECAPGANPFDALISFDHVAELSKTCDYTVVLYHGGKEHYQYPSPVLQRVCRKFVNRGANLVVCQHSHCIGCEEKYEKGTIVYGQGNFIFDSNKGPFSSTSLLIKINDDFSVEYLPLVKAERGVRFATGEIANNILSAFQKRCDQMKIKGFVRREYDKIAKKELNGYLLTYMGYNHRPFLRFFNKLSGYRLSKWIVKAYKKKDLLAIRNSIECESHREMFLTAIKKLWI